jgi:ribonuclease I
VCSSDLWPQITASTYPKDCRGLAFNTDNFLPLLPKLHQYWHNFEGKDKDFWEREWRKHGTCTGLTEAMYFEKAIECFEKVHRKGAAWVQMQSNLKIPFGLDFEIKTDLFL